MYFLNRVNNFGQLPNSPAHYRLMGRNKWFNLYIHVRDLDAFVGKLRLMLLWIAFCSSILWQIDVTIAEQ
jgi:hypothetical protein